MGTARWRGAADGTARWRVAADGTARWRVAADGTARWRVAADGTAPLRFQVARTTIESVSFHIIDFSLTPPGNSPPAIYEPLVSHFSFAVGSHSAVGLLMFAVVLPVGSRTGPCDRERCG